MLKKAMMTMCAVALSAATLAAQARPAQPTTPAKPAESEARPAPAQKAPPEPPPLPVNIKIEILITDQSGPGDASKKTVTMIVGDRQSNSIRTSAQVKSCPTCSSTRSVGINVDARPVVSAKEPNKVQLMFGLEYSPRTATGGGNDAPEPNTSSLSQRLTLNLESGKSLLVSQAADPTSDRKITVEVTATILK